MQILLNAIDEADPDHIAQQLLLLHDSLLDVPLEKLKVVIFCRDFAWFQLRQHRLLPQYEELEELNRRSFRSCRTIHIPDFSHEELNNALRRIGATELLTAGEYGASIDRHVSAVRDLIQHPGTFEHYADLHASGIWYLSRRHLERTARQKNSSPPQTSENTVPAGRGQSLSTASEVFRTLLGTTLAGFSTRN